MDMSRNRKIPIFTILICSVLWLIFAGVDSVGTICASLVTYASIQALEPDLIINAGTAGGFKVIPSAKFCSFLLTKKK